MQPCSWIGCTQQRALSEPVADACYYHTKLLAGLIDAAVTAGLLGRPHHAAERALDRSVMLQVLGAPADIVERAMIVA